MGISAQIKSDFAGESFDSYFAFPSHPRKYHDYLNLKEFFFSNPYNSPLFYGHRLVFY